MQYYRQSLLHEHIFGLVSSHDRITVLCLSYIVFSLFVRVCGELVFYLQLREGCILIL